MLVLLGASSTVFAAPSGAPKEPKAAQAEPSKAERAEERALREFMRAGVQEAEANNWEGAARAYRSAWQLRKHFAIALSLAEAETRLGNYLFAAKLWQFYLENAPAEAKDPDVDAAAELAKCRAELGSIEVKVKGASAIVLVNDEEIGKTPISSELWLKPGSYELKARRGAEWSLPREVTLKAGGRVSLELEFPQPASSTVVPAGAGEAQSPTSNVADSGSSALTSRSMVVIGGSVLTALAATVGVVYWRKSETLDADAARLRGEIDRSQANASSACSDESVQSGTAHPVCPKLESTVSDQQDAVTLTRVFLGTAGVLGTATIATYLLWPDEPEQVAGATPRVIVAPGLWPSGTGIQLGGVF